MKDVSLNDLTPLAAAELVALCGYTPANARPTRGTPEYDAVHAELFPLGLMDPTGNETDKAHELVEDFLFIQDALERHG